jgi:uncharacterized protein
MIKIVIDTNNLISALGWEGKSRELFEKVIDNEYTLYISTKQIEELKRVMNYKKFNFTIERKTGFLAILFHMANVINTTISFDALIDKSDNMILECAVEAGADYIITGDNQLLALKEFKGVKIVSVNDFLTINFP